MPSFSRKDTTRCVARAKILPHVIDELAVARVHRLEIPRPFTWSQSKDPASKVAPRCSKVGPRSLLTLVCNYTPKSVPPSWSFYEHAHINTLLYNSILFKYVCYIYTTCHVSMAWTWNTYRLMLLWHWLAWLYFTVPVKVLHELIFRLHHLFGSPKVSNACIIPS